MGERAEEVVRTGEGRNMSDQNDCGCQEQFLVRLDPAVFIDIFATIRVYSFFLFCVANRFLISHLVLQLLRVYFKV